MTDEQRQLAIEQAAEILRRGGLVVFPTETVYGLGAHAFNRSALERIFEVKQRPRSDPLIVHVASEQEAGCLVKDFPAEARALAQRFWPGPLTLVLPKIDELPELVTAGLGSVAIRVPNHPVALALLTATGLPLAAPSANMFGQLSPTTAAHVAAPLAAQVDMILDGGPCSVGVESTIISFCHDRPTLLRPGGLPVEEIEAIIGPLAFLPPGEAPSLSPGRLPKHYAPRTPLVLAGEGDKIPDTDGIGMLCLRQPDTAPGCAAVETLSASGDLREAAANLYSALERLDAQGLKAIVAFAPPETGLGRAIADRLRRASGSTNPAACQSESEGGGSEKGTR